MCCGQAAVIQQCLSETGSGCADVQSACCADRMADVVGWDGCSSETLDCASMLPYWAANGFCVRLTTFLAMLTQQHLMHDEDRLGVEYEGSATLDRPTQRHLATVGLAE
jgi:hypothetical protein